MDRVPTALNVNNAAGEIDVVDPKRSKLAEPKARIHRRRPDLAISRRSGRDQGLGLVRRCVALSAAADRWQMQTGAGADDQLPAADRTAIDGPYREKVGPGSRTGSVPLQGARRRIPASQAPRPPPPPTPPPPPLETVARPIPDRPLLRALVPGVPGLLKCDRLRRSERTLRESDQGISSPCLRPRQGCERFADPLALAVRPDTRPYIGSQLQRPSAVDRQPFAWRTSIPSVRYHGWYPTADSARCLVTHALVPSSMGAPSASPTGSTGASRGP